MIKILSGSSVPCALLNELRGWFEAEWGTVDPFEGNHPQLRVPSPVVAIDDQESLVGGLSFTSASKPASEETSDEIGVWINLVLVSPSQRKKGIASRLVQSAQLQASNMGIPELFVFSEFPWLYQKLGWQVVGNQIHSETVLHKVF